jgi:hypothetical protein
VLVALAIGVASAALTASFLRPGLVTDFTFWWTTARLVLDGANPYTLLTKYDPSAPPPYDAPFAYPLPTVLAVVPLTWLPLRTAAVVFAGISGSVLAHALTRRAWWPLVTCLSAPYVMAILDGQWSPLIMAVALVPRLIPLLWCKPTLGLVALAYVLPEREQRRAIVVGVVVAVAVGVATLAVIPTWPWQWVRTAMLTINHSAPITRPFGFVLLLALLRWRRREAWVLLVMACVPQLLLFYDQLLLWLIPRTRREATALTAVSAVGMLTCTLSYGPNTAFALVAGPWVMASCYLPALLLVLWQPAEGTVPAWAARRAELGSQS